MARSVWREGRADPVFSMQSIADGGWDPQIHRWCANAAAEISRLGTPLLAEFGTEVNGDWFPWNGRWNGAGETSGYGDPAAADGPERFRDAYRRIVGICRAEGATGITWLFHVDLDGNPDASWNRIAEYYPGDEWVDWIGVSDYGLLKPGWSAPDFAAKLDRGYDEVAALSPTKPIAVLEYGYAERRDPRPKARWRARCAPSPPGAGRGSPHCRTGTRSGETATGRSPTCGSTPPSSRCAHTAAAPPAGRLPRRRSSLRASRRRQGPRGRWSRSAGTGRRRSRRSG
jgi:hypothetical protein